VIDSRTVPYAALVLRVSLGVMYVAHSLVLKYFVFTLPGTAQFFQSLGLPGALIPILAGATWVHAGNGWVFSAANGGWEYPVFLIAASLVLALLGDGKYALTLRKENYA
jgi:putative oxidoreductase